MARVSYSYRALKAELGAGTNRIKMRGLVKESVEKQVAKNKNELFQNILAHPVTQELAGGNMAENSSGLLGGMGNLFSFIGFPDGFDPIGPILKVASRRMPVKVRGGANSRYRVEIKIPDEEDFYDASPIPWLAGASWAEGIERGIAGLGRFLYDEEGFNNSRAFTGLQATQELRGVSMATTPYLSNIIRQFKLSILR